MTFREGKRFNPLWLFFSVAAGIVGSKPFQSPVDSPR